LEPLQSISFASEMVVEDHKSLKGVILDLEPYNKTIDAKETTLLNSLNKQYGLLDKAIPDRRPQSASHEFQELKQLLEIKLTMSTAQASSSTKE
jgi:hypothetical protein